MPNFKIIRDKKMACGIVLLSPKLQLPKFQPFFFHFLSIFFIECLMFDSFAHLFIASFKSAKFHRNYRTFLGKSVGR